MTKVLSNNDLVIDDFAPFLRNRVTKRLYECEFHTVKINAQLASRLLAEQWLFDWSKYSQSLVTMLSIKGSNVPEGLVAYREMQGFTRLELVEAAPYNIDGNKKYEGVGPHLFAIVAAASIKNGNDGYVSFTPKTELHDYYAHKLGAKNVGNGDQYFDHDTSLMLCNAYLIGGVNGGL